MKQLFTVLLLLCITSMVSAQQVYKVNVCNYTYKCSMCHQTVTLERKDPQSAKNDRVAQRCANDNQVDEMVVYPGVIQRMKGECSNNDGNAHDWILVKKEKLKTTDYKLWPNGRCEEVIN